MVPRERITETTANGKLCKLFWRKVREGYPREKFRNIWR